MINILLFFSKKVGTYDVAISYSQDIWYKDGGFYGGCNRYVLKRVHAKKKIAWIHSEPVFFGLNHRRAKETYEKFDFIVNVSNSCKRMFDEIIPEYEYKSKVVFNMFDINKIHRLMVEDYQYNHSDSAFTIVTVARLSNKAKRIDKIVEVCKMLKNEGYNFCWIIVGDGPDREFLIKQAINQEVNDKIIFLGEQTNPYVYMKNADLFVLTSDYESYGMVIKESLIVGTPVISTNFPAASEIIRDGIDGILVDSDIIQIYKVIKDIIDNPHKLKKMQQQILATNIGNEEALMQLYSILKE